MSTPTCGTIAADVVEVFDALLEGYLNQPYPEYTIATEMTTIPPPVLPSYAAQAAELNELITSVPTPTIGQCPLTQTGTDIYNNITTLLADFIPSNALSYNSLSDAVMKGPYAYFLQASGNSDYWGEINFSQYESIPVMTGFVQYGGIAYFNQVTGLAAIQYLGTLHTVTDPSFPNVLNAFASTMSFHLVNVFNFGQVYLGSAQAFANVASQIYSNTNVDNDILTLMTYGVPYNSSLTSVAAYVIPNVWAYDVPTAYTLIEEAIAAGPMTRSQILGWSESPFYLHMLTYIEYVSLLFDALDIQPVGTTFTRDRIVDMFCVNALNAFTSFLGIKLLSNHNIFPSRLYTSNPLGGWSLIDQNWAAVSAEPALHTNYALNSTTAIDYFSSTPIRQTIYKIWTHGLPIISSSYFMVNSFNISVGN